MHRKTYIIRFLVQYTTIDEKVIRKALNQFWKRNPKKGLNGNCGYVAKSYWEHENPKKVAAGLMHDVLKGGIDYRPPFTEQYWMVMTDPKEVRRLKYKYISR